MILFAIIFYIIIAFVVYCCMTYNRIGAEWRTSDTFGTPRLSAKDIVRDNIEDVFSAFAWPGMLTINMLAFTFGGIAFMALMIVEPIYNFFHKPKG